MTERGYSNNIKGALWILASCAATTVMAIGIRELTPQYHTSQVAFARCLVGLILILPAVVPDARSVITTHRFRLHLLRGVLAVAGINMGYYAISSMPLVTVTALFFTAPLFVTLLAVLILGESVGWRRWAATFVGFCGAMIVVGLHPQRFEPVMLLAIGSSLTFALALVVGKKLSSTERPLTILFYFGVITSVGCLPPALVVWQTPDLDAFLLLLVVAVFATTRSYCDIRGYAAGDASFVAPWFYFRILFMGAAGYLLFSEIPQSNAVLGAAVIVCSTLYIARHEHRSGKALSMPLAG